MQDEYTPPGSLTHADAHPDGYQPPAFEVIALDCEITAYAPDGDDPLF